MPSLVVTFLGPDRPGLVSALSGRVAAAGGVWLESRLARLAGKFAGIVRLEVGEAESARLVAALQELNAAGLSVTVQAGETEPEAPRKTLRLELLGHDRPGIVRDVTQALSALDVNIEQFESDVSPEPFTGQAMFRAEARLRAPEGLPLEALRRPLERIASELMVDIGLAEGE